MFSRVLSLLLLASLPVCAAQPSDIHIRLGVVSYDELDDAAGRYAALCAALSQPGGPAIQAQTAIGTYAEVLHWVARGTVDVAVLSAGAYAELLGSQSSDEPRCEYLATEGLAPASLSWASTARKTAPSSHEYRALCLVGRDSPLQNTSGLRAAAARGRVQFVLVDPLSISGATVPLLALQEEGIAVSPGSIEYTYSHARSLELLKTEPRLALPGAAPRERVAMVFDGAASPRVPDPAACFRALDLAALAKYPIPADVWVARPGFEHTPKLRELLLAHRGQTGPAFAARPNDCLPVREWLTALGQDSRSPVTFDGVASLLRHYARSQGKPPRLALVLSGGGAKCSYQVGAVSALENRLAGLRAQYPDEPWMDFALVVGTSGGALNALPVAMRCSATPEGQRAFASLWTDLDLRDMVRPAAPVCLSIGIWLACVYMALGLLITHFVAALGTAGTPKLRPAVGLALALAVLAFVIVVPWAPANVLANRVLNYTGAWFSFGQLGSVLALPVAFLIAHCVRRTPAGRRALAWTLAVLILFALPLCSTLLLALSGPTLFAGAGMETTVARSYGKLIGAPGTFPELSHKILAAGLVKRDLVITGNCLPPVTPADRYFYLPGSARVSSADPRPNFGRHGVPIEAHPALLLDIVAGSGALYPLFPPRILSDFPAKGARSELVDGGFAHNSPVEGAVLWGATHVVLIEASPPTEQRGDKGNLAVNTGVAFDYLYDQAQLADARTREKVVVFTLRPRPPHISILDFAPDPISDSIQRGTADAQAASFARQPGEPRFREAGAR